MIYLATASVAFVSSLETGAGEKSLNLSDG